MNRLREASLIEIICTTYLVFAVLFIVWVISGALLDGTHAIVDLISVVIALSALFVAWKQAQITKLTLTPYARFLQPHHNNKEGCKLTLFNAGLSTLTVHDITIEWRRKTFSLVTPDGLKSFRDETKGASERISTYDVDTVIPPTTEILVLGSDWDELKKKPSVNFYNTIKLTAYLRDYKGRVIEVHSKWTPMPYWSCMPDAINSPEIRKPIHIPIRKYLKKRDSR